MTKSKIFLYFCLCFAAGIFIDSFFHLSQHQELGFFTPHLYVIGGLLLGIFLISVPLSFSNLKRTGLVVLGFCVLFFIFGVWRHYEAELKIINNGLKVYNDQEQKVVLVGTIIKEPDIRAENTQLQIECEAIKSDFEYYDEYNEQDFQNVKGKVLITIRHYPEYQYGDRLKIIGHIKTPHIFEDFNYKEYLQKDGIYSVMYYPKINLIELTGRTRYSGGTRMIYSVIYGKVLSFKKKLRETIGQNLSPPQSSILGAMLSGDKRGISEQWKQKLNIAGIRHITCISGMHVAILTSILMGLFIGLGLWRQQAFYLTIITIIFFIIMTGLQPSAVRAGIMGGLFLLAQHLGRASSASRAVVFAAVIMLFHNPLLLKLDVGFQLSFLAILGIIYFLPVFRDWLNFVFAGKFLNLKSILAMTLSAQVFTLPILIYNFGYMSLAAPLTNILIVPLLPFIMFLGFIFASFGIIFQPLGWILSWPVWLLLTYLIKIVDWVSGFSFASFNLEINWIWLIILYLILGFLAQYFHQKQKLKFLNY